MRCLRCRELQGREWIGAVFGLPGREIQHGLGSDVSVDVYGFCNIIFYGRGHELLVCCIWVDRVDLHGVGDGVTQGAEAAVVLGAA